MPRAESPDEAVAADQESEDDLSASRTSLERQAPQRGNTMVHVCWHRNTSVSMVDFSVAVEVRVLTRGHGFRGWGVGASPGPHSAPRASTVVTVLPGPHHRLSSQGRRGQTIWAFCLEMAASAGRWPPPGARVDTT